MKDLLRFAWDVLLFKHDAYVQHAASANALKRGLLLLIVVTLLAGTISFIIDAVRGVTTPEEIPSLSDIAAQMPEPLQPMVDQFLSNIPPEVEQGMSIARRIMALPTPLPRGVGSFLTVLGGYLSTPLGRLSAWASYGIWIILASRLLKGKAHIAQLLGTTALYVIPHILDIFSFIPFLGALIGLVATLWGIAIFVKGLAVANEFSIGKAILVAILPVLALIGLGLLITLVNVIVVAIAG